MKGSSATPFGALWASIAEPIGGFGSTGRSNTLEAQMGYLKGLRRVKEDELHRFIAGKTMPANFVPAAQEPRQAQRIQSGRHTAIFDILRHVGKVRKVGRNYVTRCPSCAEAGHDRSGDNLAIRIDRGFTSAGRVALRR